MSCDVFVIGASGNIGRELAAQLVRVGVRVRFGARNPTRAWSAVGVEVVAADFARPDLLAAAMAGCDKVFLVNPLTPAMARQAATVAAAARQVGVRRLVRSSGLGADVDSPTLIGRWHREAEQAVEASGIPFTHLRPNVFMQNFARMHGHSIRDCSAFYQPLGDGRTSYIDARDVAAAAVVVLTQPGHENKGYTLTGPQALSCQEAAEILSRTLERRIEYVDVPEAAARKAMFESGMSRVTVDALAQHLACMKASRCAMVTGTFEELTGRPAASFAQYAKDHARAFFMVV